MTKSAIITGITGQDGSYLAELLPEKGYEVHGLIRQGLTGKEHVKVDPKLFRPAEVEYLVGDYSKAKRVFGWEPKVTFKELVKMMVEADIERLKHR